MSNGNQRWGLYLLSRVLAPFSNNAWFLTSTTLMLAAITLGCLYLWNQYSEAILSQPEFKLTSEKLQVTATPEWIKSDVKADAIIRGRLLGANIMDPEISLRINRAFRSNPWVRDVPLVNPSGARGRGVIVELEWRRPVAFVIVDARNYGQDYAEGLFPVDEEGVLLPQEIPSDKANEYPKIGGISTEPNGRKAGLPWGDSRVTEAAEIAVLLEDMWHDLGLKRIDVPTIEEKKTKQAFYRLVLLNNESTVWGSAPGKEIRDESSAAEKVARLRQLLKEPDDRISQAIRDVDLRQVRWASRR